MQDTRQTSLGWETKAWIGSGNFLISVLFCHWPTGRKTWVYATYTQTPTNALTMLLSREWLPSFPWVGLNTISKIEDQADMIKNRSHHFHVPKSGAQSQSSDQHLISKPMVTAALWVLWACSSMERCLHRLHFATVFWLSTDDGQRNKKKKERKSLHK